MSKASSDYILTGGNGTLGTEVQKYLDCFAPDRNMLDITWTAGEIAYELYPHYNDSNCKGIIHAAAWTDVPGAEVDKAGVVNANIIGTKNIVDLGRMYQVPVYYISTDYVYPGHIGNYKEDAKTEPFNFYGFTKLAGETFLDSESDLIIRTSFKPNDLWEKKYNKAFIDIYTSADYVDIIAKDISFAIHMDLKGVYNIGTEKKCIYELATKRYPEVEELSRWDVYNTKMPSDISMNVEKYTKFKEQHLEEFNNLVGGADE